MKTAIRPRKLTRLLVLLALVGLVIALGNNTVHAAAASSGTIGGRPANPDASNPRTKSIFIKTIKPGESARDAVEVVNSTGAAKQVKVYATDSVRSSGGAFACAQAADTPKSVGSWITPNTTTITVPANKSVKVPFVITAPATASVGEQNGCIVIQEDTDPTFQGGIGINFRTAIRVAVLVPGEVVKQLAAVSLKVSQTDDKIVLTPTAKNTGNVSLDTTVTTNVRTVVGTSQSANTSTFPVLRGEQAEWNIESQKPFWGGLYIASYGLTYDASDNFIDPQNATSQRQTLSGTSKLFFVTPAPAALTIELVLAALVVTGAGWLVKNQRNRRYARQNWRSYAVAGGDDIQSIAKDHAITWKALARANNIRAPYLLRKGQTIKVPPRK